MPISDELSNKGLMGEGLLRITKWSSKSRIIGPWRMIRSDNRHSCGLDHTYTELLEDEESDDENSWAFRDYGNWKGLKVRLAVEDK